MLEYLINIDTKLFLFLNGFNSSFWDKAMWFFSGRIEWIPLYLAIIGFLIYKYRWKSVLLILSTIVLITLSDQLSVLIFKNTVQRLRPCHQPEIQSLVHIVRGHCGGMYGFISSHAANSFALAAFTSFLFKYKPYTVFIFIWAGIISYSRIYLGVHYPGDVIAGIIFGIFLARIIILILVKINRKYKLKLNI